MSSKYAKPVGSEFPSLIGSIEIAKANIDIDPPERFPSLIGSIEILGIWDGVILFEQFPSLIGSIEIPALPVLPFGSAQFPSLIGSIEIRWSLGAHNYDKLVSIPYRKYRNLEMA